ncbi:hypothetical protein PILCRDRAFT_725075 [Piloderma croceum F 1598]|uniref:Uncharacterized protein n=1 Tax=Piloderma croceum (strain F 1598) TaxID=765440 RepID=A0A0C3F122_PILCF|nr:hypothetical protein PILCRDRAFT_725075 [Piloderma croceum F 1598]
MSSIVTSVSSSETGIVTVCFLLFFEAGILSASGPDIPLDSSADTGGVFLGFKINTSGPFPQIRLLRRPRCHF